MKKILLVMLVVGMMVTGCGKQEPTENPVTNVTDEELLTVYIAEKYGDEYIGVLNDQDLEDKWIEYEVFYVESGKRRYVGSVDRDYATRVYNKAN